MHLALALLLFQQVAPAGTPCPRVPALDDAHPVPTTCQSFTSPPSGDTVGYWQQRVHYRITAQLDERAQALHARADLVYVNNSPDTLREMYLHQYLNAFRPGSRWSAADEREGVERFQHLTDPAYGYERFTAAPTVDGLAVAVDYPGAPDSTVAHLRLPAPLAPGDSIRLHFEWDARPSLLPRRQGRRGRHWDFAQWYPKVAVYDRGGWEPNPFVPAGELYGEFGSYDVTMLVPEDDIIGATGVPVAGDPGWERARRWGEVHMQRDFYGAVDTTLPAAPPGYRAVRFLAKNVHHFAWTAAPYFRYEGGLYDGRVAINVLYQPGDSAEWGGGQAVRRTAAALRWLESVYGRYLYPQFTNVHRIESGGTEFPMMVMNGSASQGLILHEGGHIYSYGMLANNEWRSGWMDEGLTSYQTAWAEGLTRPERASGKAPALAPGPEGYRAHAVLPSPFDRGDIGLYALDLTGRAEPIGTRAQDFNEFAIYNQMIYSRAQQMYGMLRDAVGDSSFVPFLHLYFDRWQLKHVDERAMRTAAEDASGRPLEWFFDEWVHHTGLIDYALRDVESRQADGGWVTRARVVRLGRYLHPMPVGVRTSSGWTFARSAVDTMDFGRHAQWVEIRTAEKPLEARLDPLHLTEDWDRRNDGGPSREYVFDWPFLNQYARDRQVVRLGPIGWFSEPGGVTLGLRSRSNYQNLVDRREFGLVVAQRVPRGPSIESRPGTEAPSLTRLQGWATVENPRLFGARPMIGVRAGLWALDGIARGELRKTWDASEFRYAAGQRVERTLALNATVPYEDRWLDPRRWSGSGVVDVSLEERRHPSGETGWSTQARVDVGWTGQAAFQEPMSQAFGVAEFSLSETVRRGARGLDHARLYVGFSNRTPLERSIGLSSLDATQTFENNFLRPAGSILAPPHFDDVHYEALGGAGLRGYSPLVRLPALDAGSIAAINLEATERLNAPARGSMVPLFRVEGFADGGLLLRRPLQPGRNQLFDAGVGLSAEGRLFDRDYRVRVDFPIYVRRITLAPQDGGFSILDASVGGPKADDVALRWTFSFGDLW